MSIKAPDWKMVSTKKNEEIYILSELIDNGACLRCLSNNCSSTEQHGIFIPDKIKIFIKNPLYIAEIKKLIEKEKITFGENSPIYTTCGFTHSKKGCRNCIEGRMKKLIFNKEELIMCYSAPKFGANKITVGLHIDIKLILKDKNYQVSAISAELILPEKENQIKDSQNQLIIEDKDAFPSLSGMNSDVPVNKPTWNYVKSSTTRSPENISESVKRIEPVQSTLTVEKISCDGLKEDSSKKVQSSEEIKTENSYENIRQVSSVGVFRKLQTRENPSDFPHQASPLPGQALQGSAEKLDNDHNLDNNLDNNYRKILKENRNLKRQNEELEKKISDLKYKIERDQFIHKNAEKYEEMIHNVKHLNNKVVEQFLDANYSEYLSY
jgi:hypothetical protein